MPNDVVAELIHRVEVLETTVAKLMGNGSQGFQKPDECREHRCTYYGHYLAYGPADLTHEGYHAAERKCSEYQSKCMAWHEDHPDKDDRHCPWCKMADQWEKRIRA